MTDNKPIIPTFNLEGICKVIAATEDGLTGSEIGKILLDVGLTDGFEHMTKWKRLYNSFISYQNATGGSLKILVFLCHAMHPSRYLGNVSLYHERLTKLNRQLSFIGYELTDGGKFRKVDHAASLSDAQKRASSFKAKLVARDVHEEIIKFCDAELLVDNYFHSVFEAVKSIAERVRMLSCVHADGAALVDVAFSLKTPLVRINLLQTDTDRSEHQGLANIIKGLFGTIRNPTAHVPKIKFVLEEQEALDLMAIVSYVHKKLDKVI